MAKGNSHEMSHATVSCQTEVACKPIFLLLLFGESYFYKENYLCDV